MNNVVEIIEALRYKLRVFGVLIDGAMGIFYENGVFCVNTTWPKLTLSKKHHSIACHCEKKRSRQEPSDYQNIIHQPTLLTYLPRLWQHQRER